MSDWQEYSFTDLLVDESISYGIVQPGFHKEGGVPVVRVNNIKNGHIEINDVLRVDSEIENKYLRTRLVGGELLITVVGSVGECAIVPATLKGWNVARAVSVARIKNEFDTRFIKYSFQAEDIKHQLYGNTNDTVQPTLNLSSLKEIVFRLPALKEQTAIAEVLSSLDDKIDLLHRQNKTLEQLAETLFRQWFVEEAEESCDTFSIGDFATVKHGFAFKGEFISPEPTNYILVTPGNFKIGGGFKFDKFKYYTTSEFPTEYIFNADDLIVTMTDLSQEGDTLGYPAFVPVAHGGEIYLHNQRVGKVQLNGIGKYFIYHLMKTEDYRWFIHGSASGTSIRHTSPSTICAFQFQRPPLDKINEFEKYATDLHQKVSMNQIQIRTLTQLRDTLLPKLMSGEVRVKS